MKKSLLGMLLSVSALSLALAIPQGTASAAVVATATVNSGVNFRSAQSVSSQVYGLIPRGTILPVEAANNYWVLVDYGGRQGYVSRPYVTIHEVPQQVSAASWVNLYDTDASGGRVVGQLKPGQSVQFVGGNEQWVVVTVGGIPRYVWESFVSVVTDGALNTGDAESLGQQVVDHALTFQGRVTYVFGRNDTTNLILDCSSFTKMVFAHFGKGMIWGSRAQYNEFPHVAKSDLKPGDLVFFSVATPGQVNHVGIYMGDGKFVNNLPHVGVVVSDLNSAHWTAHYIGAARVVN